MIELEKYETIILIVMVSFLIQIFKKLKHTEMQLLNLVQVSNKHKH